MNVYRLEFNSENNFERYLLSLGLHAQGAKIISQKLSRYCFRIDWLKGFAANILKQEALSLDAECALPHDAVMQPDKEFSVLLMGTFSQMQKIADKLTMQSFASLRELGTKLKSQLTEPEQVVFSFRSGKKIAPLMMGILNVTPDSFSDGGQYLDPQKALLQAQKLIAQGADIIDVGGESTRPGADEVSAEEEVARVVPIIELLCKEFAVPVSVDTTKSAVAKAAVAVGAEMINDVSGLTADPELARVAAENDSYLVVMHRSANSKEMQTKTEYDDLLGDILGSLDISIQKALSAGVSADKIIVDPGIGFGKTVSQNLELVDQLIAFKSLGCPILLGTSRKSFLGAVLDKEDPKSRDVATAVTTVHGIMSGVDIVRVHNVDANVDALNLTRAMKVERSV